MSKRLVLLLDQLPIAHGIEVNGLTVPRLTTIDHNSKHTNTMDIS